MHAQPAARAGEEPHRRSSGKDAETGLPVLSLDYEIIEEGITVLVIKDNESGAALAYDCAVR